MSDFGDDLDRAEVLARRERDAGVARLQSTLRSLTQAVGVDPDCTECSDCGDDIGAKRKAAAPWTTRCVGCQELSERRGRPVAFGELARDAVERLRRGRNG